MDAKVVIENPAKGGGRLTSRECAAEYVAKGRAEWTPHRRHGCDRSQCPGRIRFVDDDYRNRSAVADALNRDRVYDSRGLLRIKEIRRIPIVNAAQVLILHRRPLKKAA